MSAGPNERRLTDACFQANANEIAEATLTVRTGRNELALLGDRIQDLLPTLQRLWRDDAGDLAHQATTTLVTAIKDKYDRLQKAVTSLDVVLEAVGAARQQVVNAPRVPSAPSGPAPTLEASTSATDFVEDLRLYSLAVHAHNAAVEAREAVMAAAYRDFQTTVLQAADTLATSLGLPIVEVPGESGSSTGGTPGTVTSGSAQPPALPPVVHQPTITPPGVVTPPQTYPPVIGPPPAIHPPYVPVDPPVTVHPPTGQPVDPPTPPNWPTVPPIDPPTSGLPGVPSMPPPVATQPGGGGINTGLVVGGALGVVGGAGAIIGLRNLAGGSAGNAIANAAGRFGAAVRGGGASPAGGAVRGGSGIQGGAARSTTSGGRPSTTSGAARSTTSGGRPSTATGRGGATASRPGVTGRSGATGGATGGATAKGGASGKAGTAGSAGRTSSAAGRSGAVGRPGAAGAAGRAAGALGSGKASKGSAPGAGAGSRAGGPGGRGGAAGGRVAGALGARSDGRRRPEDERDHDALTWTTEDEWLDEADPGRGVVG